MRILIVDDNEDICKLVPLILDSHATCEYVLSGEEALKKVAEHWKNDKPFDVIFLDIMMPDMDGITCLKELRQMESDNAHDGSRAVKVIMLTAYNDPKHVLDSFKEHADGYIVKPFDEEKLLNEMKIIGAI